MRLVFDVTTLVNSASYMSGIVRVESELALQALGHDNVVFIVYVGGCWREISKNMVNEKISNIARIGGAWGSRSFGASSSAFLAEFMRRFARWIDKKIIRKFIFEHREDLKTVFIVLQKVIKNSFRIKRTRRTRLGEKFKFGNEDVYFVCGMSWQDNSFEDLLCQKKQLGFKVITVCHDLILHKFPHFAYPGTLSDTLDYFNMLPWVSDKVLCVSECTRRDFLAFTSQYDLPKVFTGLLRLGVRVAPESREPICAGRYFLCIGTIEPRKNIAFLYYLWLRMVRTTPRERIPELKIVGKAGWCSDDLLFLLKNDRRITDFIEVVDNVRDAEICDLYAGAIGVVFPSFYEGWGLPVSEALARGKLCIASSTPALVEAGAGMAVHVDECDFEKWIEVLLHYYNDPNAVAEIEQRVRANYVLYSWEETFRSVLCEARAL